MEPPNPEPSAPEVTAPATDPAPPAKTRSPPPARTPRVAPAAKEVEAAIADPLPSPANVLEWVSLKILADPREGRVEVKSQGVEVGERITLPVGAHTFRYTGDGWNVMCRVLVTATSRRIKFLKDGGSCELY